METDTPHEIDTSIFSVGAVLAHSFSTFFTHPFVFLGLSILAQVPGFVLMITMRNSLTKAWITLIVNFIFGLAIQGAIAYGVYEVLRGDAARFGKSLSRGMARVIPLTFAVLSYSMFLNLVFFGGVALAGVMGRLSAVLIVPSMLLILLALWCKWIVFVPACVVERLGPIMSLNRSSDLTKGCRLKIAAIYLLYFVIALAVGFVFAFFTKKFNSIVLVVLQQFVYAALMALGHVTTAVIYYGLREVKEGVGIEQLANVFD